MSKEHILKKLQKLKALASDPAANVNEAAAAAAAASKLMMEFRIDEAELADEISDEDDPLVQEDLLAETGQKRGTSWQIILLSGLCEANSCKLLISGLPRCFGKSQKLKVFGQQSDVSAVRYLFQFCIREINRLCGSWDPLASRSQRTAFRLGAADSISYKARQARKEVIDAARVANKTTALVRVENALARVNDFYEKAIGGRKLRNYSGGQTNERGAYCAGRKAGDTVSLGGNSRSITAPVAPMKSLAAGKS